MAKKILSIVLVSIFMMLMTMQFLAAQTGNTGNVYFDQNGYSVGVESRFTTNILVNSGSQNLASYGISIFYDPIMLSVINVVDGGVGISPIINNTVSGKISAAGFDAMGKGPGSNLAIMSIEWQAGNSDGTTAISLTIDTLTSSDYISIGTKGSSVPVSITAFLPGDVNSDGVVTIVDALMAAQISVGLPVPVANMAAADVNCDGIINIIDGLMIAQYYVGILAEFPCGPVITPTPTPTATTIIINTPTPTPTSTNGNPPTLGPHLDNPFVDAVWYLDENWGNKVRESAALTGGALGAKIAQLADNSTALWLDRIAAITEGIGLRGHLDAAVAQGANLINIVIYNLPNRDCSALASNGELRLEEDGMNRYMHEYIDPIAAILGDPAYYGLRIVAVIEVDSLPNMVTNLANYQECRVVDAAKAYDIGIQYALNELSALPNVYKYVDIAHSGWLGWDSNLVPSAKYISNVIKGTTRGFSSVDGFISNTSNYTPVREIFLPDPSFNLNYSPIRGANFYEWNYHFDEYTYSKAMYDAFRAEGFPSTIGMLIDTSRNGWGGPNRPTAVSTATNVNDYVNESRLDKRFHRGNWCNQNGAGVGERPRALPYPVDAPHIDAFVWIKPPGESDGISTPDFPIDPNDPNKKHDPMCAPAGNSAYNNAYGTGAIEAPHAGRWNQLHVEMLVENAFPPFN